MGSKKRTLRNKTASKKSRQVSPKANKESNRIRVIKECSGVGINFQVTAGDQWNIGMEILEEWRPKFEVHFEALRQRLQDETKLKGREGGLEFTSQEINKERMALKIRGNRWIKKGGELARGLAKALNLPDFKKANDAEIEHCMAEICMASVRDNNQVIATDSSISALLKNENDLIKFRSAIEYLTGHAPKVINIKPNGRKKTKEKNTIQSKNTDKQFENTEPREGKKKHTARNSLENRTNMKPESKLKREQFLLGLKSNGKHQYTRYNGLPLRYAGGKSLAVGHVINRMRDGIEVMASPFLGGGSIEIACANELGIRVFGYDIFDILAEYWKVQLRAPVKLAEAIMEFTPDNRCYKKVKERLRLHWVGKKLITNKVELAAHYWFNHNLSYGPGFLGWMSKIYEEPDRFARLVEKVRSFRCPLLKVNHGRFENTIPKHCNHFLYCDPPYYLEGDSKMFRGIYPQRNFPVHHNGFDHEALKNLLHQHKGGFILSYNDCEKVRDWYSNFEIQEVKWQYTLGQGETRIGKNRIENGTNHHVKQSHELLIIGKPTK